MTHFKYTFIFPEVKYPFKNSIEFGAGPLRLCCLPNFAHTQICSPQAEMLNLYCI